MAGESCLGRVSGDKDDIRPCRRLLGHKRPDDPSSLDQEAVAAVVNGQVLKWVCQALRHFNIVRCFPVRR